MFPKTPKELISWLKQKNLFAKKSLSQNFLIDFPLIEDIVKLSNISKYDTVLEIGPGPGVLTIALLKTEAKVISVEKDRRFAKELAILFSNFSNFELIEGDILKVFSSIFEKYNSLKIVANIPYSLTSSILEKLCEQSSKVSSATLMVQKEFGERVCAKKGKVSGSISRFVQFYYDPLIAQIVPKDSFFPAPKIDSCILTLQPKEHPQIDEARFFNLVQFAFQNRRKKLISSLKKRYPIQHLKDIFDKMHLSDNTRAEELLLEDFLELFRMLQK